MTPEFPHGYWGGLCGLNCEGSKVKNYIMHKFEQQLQRLALITCS